MESRLKDILKEQGRSQTWLCEKVGVSNTTMTSLVNRKRLPTLPVAIRIAKAIGVPVEEIWFEQ